MHIAAKTISIVFFAVFLSFLGLQLLPISDIFAFSGLTNWLIIDLFYHIYCKISSKFAVRRIIFSFFLAQTEVL